MMVAYTSVAVPRQKLTSVYKTTKNVFRTKSVSLPTKTYNDSIMVIDKAVLRTLAVVALIATSEGKFVEFSEKAVETYSPADIEASKTDVEVINPEREFTFYLPFIEEDDSETDVFLYPDESSDSVPENGHSICGNLLGIHIADVGTFCNSSLFHAGISTFSPDEELMQFSIYFDSAVTKPCYLGIPVFQIPSKLDSSDPEKLKEWATQNQVSLLSPVTAQKLRAVHQSHGLTTDFKWLSDLLKFGVFKTAGIFEDSTGSVITAYTSRPMVASEEYLKLLKTWIAAE